MEALLVLIDRIALAKQGDNAFGNVCLSIRMSLCALLLEPFVTCLMNEETAQQSGYTCWSTV